MEKQRFKDNGNGTVTDNAAGLMWLRNLNDYCGGSKQTWDEATEGCNNFNFAGFEDWRLPNLTELKDILKAERTESGHGAYPFINVRKAYYWTSPTLDTSSGWIVNFTNGTVNDYSKEIAVYVWPVRNGQ